MRRHDVTSIPRAGLSCRACRYQGPIPLRAERSSSTRDASKPVDPERRAPAAAAAAPAGISPTSSEPGDLGAARRRLRLDPRDDLVQRRRLPVLDVHAHLDEAGAAAGRARARARPGSPPSRSRTTAAISRATSTSAPRRLTLNAISGAARADEHAARALGSSCGGPKSGAELARVDRAAAAPSGPPRRKNAGPRPGASSP